MKNVVTGTVRMADGTNRNARKMPDGRIEFATFANANSTLGKAWRKATSAQADTFAPNI